MEFDEADSPYPFAQDHPRSAELVPEHRKPGGEEGFLHLHEDFSTLGQEGIDSFGVLGAINE